MLHGRRVSDRVDQMLELESVEAAVRLARKNLSYAEKRLAEVSQKRRTK